MQGFKFNNETLRRAIKQYFKNKEEVVEKYGPIGNWDVSEVTNMKDLFTGQTLFDEDIGQWNTSSVTTMSGMFFRAEEFNQDLGGWDVSGVTNMYAMFCRTTKFNQDLKDWDVSKVTNMSFMFKESGFNQDLNDWNTSLVTNVGFIFAYAEDFDPRNVKQWDLSKATDEPLMWGFVTKEEVAETGNANYMRGLTDERGWELLEQKRIESQKEEMKKWVRRSRG